MLISLPFGIQIDFSFLSELFSQSAGKIILDLFFIFGWVFLWYVFFWLATFFWQKYRGGKYTANWEFILLAVDVPAVAVQTPKAVEQIFAHLSGAYEPVNVWEKWWQGKQQRYFSFEIISIEGYIQFLVWTEKDARDLVEASIYAQYPEAEITEVEDYMDFVPGKYPNEEYDLHGIEFGLMANEAYPIRTYPDFKYDVTPEITFSDSMAALLENFTRLGRGENLWMQIIIVPTDSGWKEGGIELVKELTEGKKPNPSILNKVGSVPQRFLDEFMAYGYRDGREVGEAGEEESKGNNLTPGARAVVEAIENKISKVGFVSKIRLMYIAKKSMYSPRRSMGGVVGAMNQFHVASRNGFVSYASTMKKGVDKKIAKQFFFESYQKRKPKVSGNPYILNIEELASVWHFPMPFVKTPLIQKTYAKRAEAPGDLPTDFEESPLKPKRKEREAEKKQEAPINLPTEETGLPAGDINQSPEDLPIFPDEGPVKTDASGNIKTDAD